MYRISTEIKPKKKYPNCNLILYRTHMKTFCEGFFFVLTTSVYKYHTMHMNDDRAINKHKQSHTEKATQIHQEFDWKKISGGRNIFKGVPRCKLLCYNGAVEFSAKRWKKKCSSKTKSLRRKT
mmetsp:Transcript_17912/g.20483  ORF Transcript_17912/g.20483 Transcript_17912/m.20483 type:complete len:123 (-) Transcript_17912:36-404(-)